ncbi:MAG: DegV family protein [Raoultibacter sp.]
MKIVADSSVMYSIEQGAQHGIEILPLTVSINGKTWAEYEDISAPEFLSYIRAGELPKSSAPTPSAALAAFDTEEEVVHLAMASGLSGAYDITHGLAAQAKHPDRVHVINSRTLCVPHRILALYAVELAKKEEHAEAVIQALQPMIESARSYLIPEDFDFLRRGGRLTPLAAKFAHLLKAVPVMIQTEDGTRLERFAVSRRFNKALVAIAEDLATQNLTEAHYIGVSHADNLAQAQLTHDFLHEAFPQCRMGIFELGPAFITQGGPGCIAIQAIDMKACPDLIVE